MIDAAVKILEGIHELDPAKKYLIDLGPTANADRVMGVARQLREQGCADQFLLFYGTDVRIVELDPARRYAVRCEVMPGPEMFDRLVGYFSQYGITVTLMGPDMKVFEMINGGPDEQGVENSEGQSGGNPGDGQSVS